MRIINTILGIPLGYIIYLAYRLTGSYGFAIIIFAVIVRIVLLPITALAHKNSIRFLQIQPALHIVKQRYSGDRERLNEEQYELYKREKYNPSIGLIPLFLQLFLVMGILQVMYNPLQHLLHLSSGEIEAIATADWMPFTVHAGSGEQLRIIEAIQHSENLNAIHTALSDFPDADNTISLMSNTDLSFLGLNLGETPSLRNPTIALIIPILSALSALIFCFIQNAISPGAISQSKGTNNGLTIFTVSLSLYFAMVTPVGVGIYWTMGNIMGIASTFALNALYNPKKLASEAISHINSMKKTPAQIREEREFKKKLRIREKADAARFSSAKKQLVFYALTGGQYKYYAEVINFIMHNSDLAIHYITNDPDDSLFQQDLNNKIIPYYISHKKTIGIMLKLDADMLVTTVPDLQNYHFKKSIVRDDIEYVYIFHGYTSIHMVMRPHALDYFDTIFCVGVHHVNETRRLEELFNLPKKRLVKAGYSMYDRLLIAYNNREDIQTNQKQILIAPSWQKDNIMELCITDVLDQLLGNDYKIIIRPHPQYTQFYRDKISVLQQTYHDSIEKNELSFELDFSESSSMYLSDIVITDWSNTAYEFSFCTKKPVIFINTPMKVLNPDYLDVGIEPSEIFLRDKVGVSIDVNNIDNLNIIVQDIFNDKDKYNDLIEKTVNEFMYCPMRSGEAGGKYILSRLI